MQKRLGLAVGVYGEAGLGKSFQVKELLKNLSCRNLSLHATTSLSVLAQHLPRPKKLPLWTEHNLNRLAKGEVIENAAVLDSLGAVLSGLAPFVLHLEDIHEADSERLEFILALARMAQRIKGVALLVTSRVQPPEPFVTIRLEPLAFEDSNKLLENELNNSLPPEGLKWIYDKAAGNPLYSLEYLRYLTRQGFLWNDGKSWHWRKPEQSIMPVTVEALIEQLLNQARAEPLQRYVLEARAFLPLDARTEVWQKVARVSEKELHAASKELMQQGIFEGHNFAHPLFREVTLKILSAERKRHLARRAINVLENYPEQAALFVEDAGLEPEKALGILKQAIAHTQSRHEAVTARFLVKASEYATGEEKIHLALEAAEILESYNLSEAVHLVERILSFEASHIPAKILLAKLYALQLRKDEARAMLYALPAEYLNSKEGLETAIEVYNRCEDYDMVITAFKEQAFKFSPLDTHVIGWVMGSLSELSRYEEVETLAAQTLAKLEPTSWSYVSILHALAFMHNASNQYHKSEGEFRKTIELIETYHQGRRLHVPLYNHGLALMWSGRLEEVRANAERARPLALAAGDIIQYAASTSLLGIVEHESGNYERAEELLLETQTTLAYRSPSQFTLDVYADFVTLYLEWQGAATHAMLSLKYARAGLQLAREYEDIFLVDSLSNMALAESTYGNAHQALQFAQEAQDVAAQARMPRARFHAAIARGSALQALNHTDLAKQAFLEAEHIAQELNIEVHANKVGLELDRLNNDLESARSRMQWFEERGLFNGVNIARRYFPELAEAKASLPQTSTMRLEVLGTPQVSTDKTIPIRGRKRQELLVMLLEARISGRSEVSKLSLLDKLYPDEDEIKANSSLKGVVHSLRDTVGDNLVTTTPTGYALGSCTSDAEQFLQTADTSLWRGSYSEDLAQDESTVRDSLYLALYDKTQSLLEADPKEAARVGNILVEAEPYNPKYLKCYLTALRLTKNHSKLNRHYHEARKHFLELGEVLPESWQAFLKA